VGPRKESQSHLTPRTLIPLGMAVAAGLVVVGAALTLGAERAAVTRQVEANSRCLERHEQEIKDLRADTARGIADIRAGVARIEGKLDRSPNP